MMAVHERLDQVAQKIKANMLNAFNPDGFLLQGENDYLNCLKLQHIRLEELFKRDDDHWNRHVEDARKDAEKVFEDL